MDNHSSGSSRLYRCLLLAKTGLKGLALLLPVLILLVILARRPTLQVILARRPTVQIIMPQPTEFYITLPSNTRVAGNTTSHFRVELPYPVDLEGQWTVGLAEIQYPVSFPTLQYSSISLQTFSFDLPNEDVEHIEDVEHKFTEANIRALFAHTSVSVSIPSGHYSTVQELLDAIHFALRRFWQLEAKRLKEHPRIQALSSTKQANMYRLLKKAEDAVKFEYQAQRQKVKVTIDDTLITGIDLDSTLQYALGFQVPTIATNYYDEAYYPPDVRAGKESIFVYCNLIAPQIVGDTQTQLLKVVPLRGKLGDLVDIDFPNIHYVELLTRKFSTVEIYIRGSDGQTIGFKYGKVIVKLHFRKKRLL